MEGDTHKHMTWADFSINNDALQEWNEGVYLQVVNEQERQSSIQLDYPIAIRTIWEERIL